MSLKKNHLVVQEELKIILDKEYATFLDTYGDYDEYGIEIYGYTPQYININEIPCVIGATTLYKQDYKLTLNEIVIAHSGFEDILIILNNKTGKIFEVSSNRTNEKKIADSFNEWHENITA